jgi:RHS repeat-associated protein
MRVVGQTTNTYAYAYDPIGNRLSASRNLDDLTYVSNEQTLEPTYDVTEYVNASGTTVAHYEYDPFGGISRQTGALADEFPHRFSTKYLDSETGLVYYGYRYYSPGMGRWLSRDPIGERDGLSLYMFCVNFPISFWDILGLCDKDGEIIIKGQWRHTDTVLRVHSATISGFHYWVLLDSPNISLEYEATVEVTCECEEKKLSGTPVYSANANLSALPDMMKFGAKAASLPKLAWSLLQGVVTEPAKAAWKGAGGQLKKAVESNRPSSDNTGSGWKGGESPCCKK